MSRRSRRQDAAEDTDLSLTPYSRIGPVSRNSLLGNKTVEHTTRTESPTFGMEYAMTVDGQMVPGAR